MNLQVWELRSKHLGCCSTFEKLKHSSSGFYFSRLSQVLRSASYLDQNIQGGQGPGTEIAKNGNPFTVYPVFDLDNSLYIYIYIYIYIYTCKQKTKKPNFIEQ